MTNDQEKQILTDAIEEAMKAGDVPSETRLHHLSTAARRLYADAREPTSPCPRCGRQLRADEQGPDGFDVGCLKLIFTEKGLSVANL